MISAAVIQPQGPSWELAEALHRRFLVMLEAYFDDSEQASLEPSLFTVAGWLGDGPAWREVEAAWRPILSDFSVAEFKSSDFANSRGEFMEWGDDKRAEFCGRLLAAIEPADIAGIVVIMERHGSIEGARRDGPYRACAYYCMIECARIVEATFPQFGERVAYSFDERHGTAGAIGEMRQVLKSVESGAWSRRVGPATQDDSVEIMPLQTADLLAYVSYLNHVHRRDAGIPGSAASLSPKVKSRTVLRWTQNLLEVVPAVPERWESRLLMALGERFLWSRESS